MIRQPTVAIRAKALGAILLALAGCAGCEQPTAPAPRETVVLEGRSFRVWLPPNSPLAQAVQLRLIEWEARSRSKAALVESDTPPEDADLHIVSGTMLGALADVPAFLEQTVQTAALAVEQLPPLYRFVFSLRDHKTVALPLASDRLLLWYRADLFDDEQIATEFHKATGKRLQVPNTWTEYLQAAEFFRKHSSVEHGCVEASDGSAAGVRNFLAHCAAYAKGPNWSSFEIDTETGEPLLTSEPFVRGLKEWAQACQASPAAGGKGIDDVTARQLFREGKAAMLLTCIPPTVTDQTEQENPLAKSFKAALLPGARQLHDARSKAAVTVEEVNRCNHLASSGWYLVLANPAQRAAAEQLALFLASEEEIDYLVRAAQKGLIPVHRKLLSQSQRFVGYGLPESTVAQFFRLIEAGLSSQNWVADMRTPLADQLRAALAPQLQAFRSGKTSAEVSLQRVNEAWRTIIEPHRQQFLGEYRDSLGLPKLLD